MTGKRSMTCCCVLQKTDPEQGKSKGKYRHIVAARSLLRYCAVNDLDMSLSKLAQRFELSATAISKAVLRGKALAMDNDYQLEDL